MKLRRNGKKDEDLGSESNVIGKGEKPTLPVKEFVEEDEKPKVSHIDEAHVIEQVTLSVKQTLNDKIESGFQKVQDEFRKEIQDIRNNFPTTTVPQTNGIQKDLQGQVNNVLASPEVKGLIDQLGGVNPNAQTPIKMPDGQSIQPQGTTGSPMGGMGILGLVELLKALKTLDAPAGMMGGAALNEIMMRNYINNMNMMSNLMTGVVKGFMQKANMPDEKIGNMELTSESLMASVNEIGKREQLKKAIAEAEAKEHKK